jgi:hypothetical protein
MSPSARGIVELNIEYYRKELQIETDAATRKTIAKLLQEEKVGLAKLVRPSRATGLLQLCPIPPVGWTDIDRSSRAVHPPHGGLSTRKDESMSLVLDHTELQVTVKWRSFYRLPVAHSSSPLRY